MHVHLKPAFASEKLDEIGYAEIQDYAAQKTLAKDDKPGLSEDGPSTRATVGHAWSRDGAEERQGS